MKILAVLFVAVTLAILFAIPANVTLNVGDDGTRVREVGMYGYGKSIFSLAPSRDDDGERLSPSAFSIGGGWHLLVMHNDRIHSMTHFRHEQPVPNTYGEWHEVNDVSSFSVARPSLLPFFLGLAVLAIVSYVLAGFRRTSRVLFVILTLLLGLFVVGSSLLAETFALLPCLFAVGWIIAALLGNRLRGWPDVNIDSEPKMAT